MRLRLLALTCKLPLTNLNVIRPVKNQACILPEMLMYGGTIIVSSCVSYLHLYREMVVLLKTGVML